MQQSESIETMRIKTAMKRTIRGTSKTTCHFISSIFDFLKNERTLSYLVLFDRESNSLQFDTKLKWIGLSLQFIFEKEKVKFHHISFKTGFSHIKVFRMDETRRFKFHSIINSILFNFISS